MAGDAMLPMPMSPRQSPTEIGKAAVQWLCSRRGRTLLLSVFVLTFILGVVGVRHSEAITGRYHALAEHQWRPYLPSLPKLTKTPFEAPSNTTLQLENGEIDHVPPKLEKTTPNFHLLMTSEKNSDAFCKSTLSAMLLNYPPPTAVGFHQTFISPGHKERQTLFGIREYLHNEKLVHDEDLLLIVDGQDTWFQLPSDVIIKQYEAVLEYANARLLKKYGLDENKLQKFNQTIIFGAEKVCEGDDTACKLAPSSILPDDIYGAGEETTSTEDLPAKYLDSRVVMGPAKDLRVFFDAALKKYEKEHTEKQTMQSVIATMFGEQQLIRDAALTEGKSATSKLREWVGKAVEEHVAAERRLEAANLTIRPGKQYEYSIGLDYTHTLFQPLLYTTLDELVPLVHENSTDLSKYRHPKTITPHLSLPPTLLSSKLPFWSPNLYLHNPSPDTNKPAYIDKLDFDFDLDWLPDRRTHWSKIPLIQNTYTGAIPALILRVPDAIHDPKSSGIPSAQISFNHLWFAPHKRALLRQYFRTPQSPNGYHNSLVGGDRSWDQRGGRGGIWTSKEQIWLPWGEVDGVCGTLAQLKQVIDDGKGVWMHELEDDNEAQRVRDEEAYKKGLEEKREKEEEKELTKVQVAAEIAKQEHEQKEQEKHNKARLERIERQKKDQAKKEKVNVERLKEIEEKKKLEVEKAQETQASAKALYQSEEQEAGRNPAASTRWKKRWAA
ncbi:hypothetical protein BU25DRAFT_30730 [Macroventuria anomochaeta]|uniref:Uncharacterized protein n=1 Tax=Macroventuria anomochaeta TaxID=301207 RepID=A0ACB6S3T0_9PLEO|nr:uncharacterized protein BU25DRAFT_30730 [Macroventuria anomochaeta]KAF2628699.1 hypothetical protein BU25DRAFT_30730 [Macroventuria anomochaeta]